MQRFHNFQLDRNVLKIRGENGQLKDMKLLFVKYVVEYDSGHKIVEEL